MHALGHGIGMEVHEEPVISGRNEKILKENMTIAIEPRCIYCRAIWCKN